MKTRPTKKEFLTAMWAAINCSRTNDDFLAIMNLIETKVGAEYTNWWWREHQPQKRAAMKILKEYLGADITSDK